MRLTHPTRRLRAILAIACLLTGAATLTDPPAKLVAAIPVIASVGPSTAAAATWDLVSCNANGSPAPIDGWTNAGAGNSSGAYNQCASGGVFGSAISEATPQPAGESIVWTFTPPAGSTIAGGTISGGLVVPYGQGGSAYFAAPTSTYDGSDVLANCQWNLPCPQSAAAPGPGSYAGTFPINPGGLLYAIASCSGLPGGAGCPGGYGPPAAAAVVIATATIQLTNNSTPVASGFGGGLLAPGPIAGTQPLTFTASDPGGPGVYGVSISVDGGKPIFAGTPDTNSGQCVSVGTDSAGNREFIHANPEPCKTTVQISVPVPTANFADGNHTVTASVTDAAGNTSQVINQPFVSSNYTKVSAGLPGPLRPPTAAGGGAGSPPAPVYAVILDPATQALGQAFHRRFASSAVSLSGTLRNSAAVPAPGVPVTLLAQNGGAGGQQPIATTTSDAAGHWVLTAPRGPSRVLAITYGTQAKAAAVEAGVSINETVTPDLSLKVKARGHGRLHFSGHLAISPLGSPRPVVQIEALSHDRRTWQGVGLPVPVTPSGAYSLNYNAGPKSITGHYTFRSVSLATSLFTAATSPTRKTVVR